MDQYWDVDFKIFGDIQRLKRRLYYLPIMIINTVLIGINFFGPAIFTVDQQNVYSREPFMWLIIILNSSVLIYISALAYKHRKEIQREVVFSILAFVVAPSIAAGLQVMIFGVFIMWPTMAVIVVITYIFNETVSTSHDYITGLYSRIRVDQYIDRLISDGRSFGVMMIDLNDFKKINDLHGHRAGDKTLAEFAKRLQEVFGKEKIVARYGGDEFMIVSKVLTTEELRDYISQLKAVTEDLVGFSIGYHDTNLCDCITYEEVVNGADSKMYIHKASFKNADK